MVKIVPERKPIFPPRKGILTSRRAHTTHLIGGSRLIWRGLTSPASLWAGMQRAPGVRRQTVPFEEHPPGLSHLGPHAQT